jgi:hypothetical protein
VSEEIPCEEVGTIEVKGFHYPVSVPFKTSKMAPKLINFFWGVIDGRRNKYWLYFKNQVAPPPD